VRAREGGRISSQFRMRTVSLVKNIEDDIAHARTQVCFLKPQARVWLRAVRGGGEMLVAVRGGGEMLVRRGRGGGESELRNQSFLYDTAYEFQ